MEPTVAPEVQTPRTRSAWALLSIGGILGALASASCCVLPFVLFTLGASGARISRLTALAPYQPIFLGLTLAALGIGFALLYRRRVPVCEPGSCCQRPVSRTGVKVALWLATALVIRAVVFPYAISLLATP